MSFDAIVVIGILVFFGLIETIAGFLKSSRRTKSDWIQEVLSFFVLSVLIKPGIVLAVILVGESIYPEAGQIYGKLAFIPAFLLYILIDDVLQYWYHRIAHEKPFLWKLHRAHHQAEEMGFFVSYRNAALYYLMMPNIWWIGLITLLGGGEVVAYGLIVKQLIIISSHSRLKWDKPFYSNKFLKPIIRVLERIIITPAFHHAHHGRSKLDKVSDPNGNFGNMFSIWDQLFGTAMFTGQYPQSYGLPKVTKDSWTAAYLYPLVKSEDESSELNALYKKESTRTKAAMNIHLEKGESYLWCQCGMSKNQPFCDGTHHGTKYKPILFEVKRTGDYQLCNCKHTKSSPFCDNSHLEL